MALLEILETREKGKTLVRRQNREGRLILKSICESQAQKTEHYDIFLSHSFNDAELILGVRQTLIDFNYTVYIDWLDDPYLDRSSVTAATAGKLRERMQCCDCLLFVWSENSPKSVWMPWELGYFDGFKPQKVAIVPLVYGKQASFDGQEYLGLYPYVSLDPISGSNDLALWINESIQKYVNLNSWLKKDRQPYLHT